MIPISDGMVSQELDPLASSSAGTAVAGVAALVWPELVAATICLGAVATLVVWLRIVRALQHRRHYGYDLGRLIPLLVLVVAGWGGAILVAPFFLDGRPLILGAFTVGLWVLARPALKGV